MAKISAFENIGRLVDLVKLDPHNIAFSSKHVQAIFKPWLPKLNVGDRFPPGRFRFSAS